VFVQETEHRREKIRHGMVIVELWRSVSAPDVLPYVGWVFADGADEPLRIIVERCLRD
jgi:hypothetical protein